MAVDLLTALVPLFVIVDPFASMGLFLGLTRGHSDRHRAWIAVKASVFAAVVLVVFALVGKGFLGMLGISLHSLQIAGGLLLTMIGLRMLREGREIPHREIRRFQLPTGGHHDVDEPEGDPSFVPLGLPMLAGPGAISLVIVQTTQSGPVVVATAAVLVMAAALVILLVAARAHVVLGDTGERVVTRIMGILTVAFAVQFVLDGITAWRMVA